MKTLCLNFISINNVMHICFKYSGGVKFWTRQKYCAQHFRRKVEALPDELES
jgi:hypothetical protein